MIDWNDVDEIYRHARSGFSLYQKLYANAPERVNTSNLLKKLPVISRDQLRLLQPLRYRHASRLYWTGGTSGISLLVEWDIQDIEKTLGCFAPLSSQLEDGLHNTVLSCISGGMGILYDVIQIFCCQTQLRHIAFGHPMPKSLSMLFALVEQQKPQLLITTPQVALRIAKDIIEQNIPHQFTYVITSGAPLTSDVRNIIANNLKVLVLDHYGCTEIGPVGLSCEANSGFHIDEKTVVAEILDPDQDGYGKLVLTSLKNHTFPVIRYAVGDIARLEYSQCSCGSLSPRIMYLKREAETLYIGGVKLDLPSVICIIERSGISGPFFVTYDRSSRRNNPSLVFSFLNGDQQYLLAINKAICNVNPSLALKLASGSLDLVVESLSLDEILKPGFHKRLRLIEVS